MSKICGLIDPAASEEEVEGRLRSMAKVIKHRPDSPEQYLLFEGGGIAVIGNPSFAEEERWARDERRGSCLGLCGHVVGLEGAAALLSAFEERGEDLIKNLNGTFAFAHYDPTTRSLRVVNDRYGFMPLYYCREEKGSFLFASEVKAILRILEPRELDWQSVADFFYIGHMVGQKTLFKGIYAMDSGQVLAYHDGLLQTTKYHDFTRTSLLSPDEVSTEKLAGLFVEAVRRRVREDRPNTLLLSGGFDSRLILGALNRLGISPKLLILEHGQQAGGMDGKLAAALARRLGLEFDFRRTRKGFFTSLDSIETFYIQDGMVPTWETGGEGLFISEVYPELDSGMGMVWDGLVLDDSLGGAHQVFEARQTLEKFAKNRGSKRLLLRLTLTPRRFLTADKGFMRRLQGEFDKIPPTENRFKLFVIKHQGLRRMAVRPYQLYSTKVEPMTPSADSDFADYALNVPLGLRTNERLYIELLRKEFPVLAEVPVFSSSSLFRFDSDELRRHHAREPSTRERLRERLRGISERAYKALGAMGVPGGRRMRTDEQQSARLVIRVLEQKRFDRPIYNKRVLRRLFAAYRAGNGAYHRLFVLVFYIELWHLLFVDKDSPILFNPRGL
jgi:asparagine synthase (glutamine-hydrolysing)